MNGDFEYIHCSSSLFALFVNVAINFAMAKTSHSFLNLLFGKV